MKKIMILSALLVVIYANAFAQTQYSKLEIGYPATYGMPAGVKLGVDGHVYIQASSGQRTIKDEFKNLFMLFVEKGVLAEDHAVLASGVWLADYVFDSEYKMRSLEEMEAYVKENKHLPEVISQRELDEKGYFSVNEMLVGQLQNLEELVLHTIAQEEKIKSLEAQIAELEQLANSLETQLKTSKK